MNPFFEQRWRDAHAALITYLRDALQEKLPPDLFAAAEEQSLAVGDDRPRTYRPDVQVREPWTLKEPAATEAPAPAASTPLTEPIHVFIEEDTERWLEIRDANGRLVTVLELLSPSNKLESPDREQYLRKRQSILGADANLVEIDLVRQGASVFPRAVRDLLRQREACYGICVVRAAQPSAREVYPIGLRERLPTIRVPLRPADPDIALDLQPLVDQCHERGRYHFLKYHLELEPPLKPDDAAWAAQLLRDHGLM